MNLNFTLILQIISFLILMLILAKVFYRPLLIFLDQRADYVNGVIKKAEEEKNKAENKFKEAERNINKAQRQILEWKNSVKLEIEEDKKRFLDKTKREKEEILNAAKKEIGREIEKAKENLRKETGNISLAIAE